MRCINRSRHWFTERGCVGLRRPTCVVCGAPNPKALTADEQANWDFYVSQEAGR